MTRAVLRLVDEALDDAQEKMGALSVVIKDRASDQARRTAHDLEKLGRQGLKSFQGAVRENPASSFGLAVGLGTLLGGLFVFFFGHSGKQLAASRVRKPRSKTARIPARRAK